MGELIITASYGNKKYDLVLTTIQGIVLLIFSECSQELTLDDISQRSGVTDHSILKPILHSLSCNPKYILLLKSGSRNKINNEDCFKINPNFHSNMKKIRIAMPLYGTSSKINADVKCDREVKIDATIVRIAKARKSVTHIDLIGEVLHQISMFHPDIKMVKHRIEGLIEREYLRRNFVDNSIYEYIS